MGQVLWLWIAINIICLLIVIFTSTEGINFSFVNPIVIYKNLKVNWFGVILLTIIFNVFFPIIAIPYWIYKLCTVGRK